MEKVEVEVNRSGDSAKTATGEGPPSAAQASSDPVQESLKVLNEEALQLSEFLWQEEKLIKELCGLLKQVLRQLNISFSLPANAFPQTWNAQKIFLNDEAHLILINDRNEITSKALEDYPPQVVFNIVSFLIPELSKSLTSYRKKISLRIGLFDKINQELRNLANTFASGPKKLEERTGPVADGVKQALQAQHKVQGEG